MWLAFAVEYSARLFGVLFKAIDLGELWKLFAWRSSTSHTHSTKNHMPYVHRCKGSLDKDVKVEWLLIWHRFMHAVSESSLVRYVLQMVQLACHVHPVCL